MGPSPTPTPGMQFRKILSKLRDEFMVPSPEDLQPSYHGGGGISDENWTGGTEEEHARFIIDVMSPADVAYFIVSGADDFQIDSYEDLSLVDYDENEVFLEPGPNFEKFMAYAKKFWNKR